ncbi:MAG: LPS assembly protein LptD [Candidatus Brocadiales bacterium]
MCRPISYITLVLAIVAISIPPLPVLNEANVAHGSIIKKDVSDWPINISSEEMSSWVTEGVRVFIAQKEVEISQGNVQIVADSAICWFQEVQPAEIAEATLEVYCEGNVTLIQPSTDQNKDVEKYEQIYLHMTTTMGIAAEASVLPIKILEEEELSETYLRAKKLREAQYGVEFASKEPLAKGVAVTIPTEEEIVDIFADNIESWAEDDLQVVVATGNVRIKREGEILTADNVILWFDRKEVNGDKSAVQTFKEVYAEGNVTLRRKNDFMMADKVFENKKENKGIYINNRFKATLPQLNIPIYFSSDEIKKISEDVFTAKNGILTTCGFGHPHFHFKGSKIRLIKNKDSFKIASTGNTLYAGKIPFLYQPYFAWTIRRKLSPLKGFESGSSSRFGSTMETDWDLYAFIAPGEQWSEWSALTLNLDYMQKRGAGVGVDFDYDLPETSGLVRSYFLSDKGDTDRLGRERVPIPHKERGRFLWRNRQLLPYDTRADLEIAYLSDKMFLREFFRGDFKQDKDQETVLYLRRLKDNTGMTFEAGRHLNNVDTLVESERERKTAESLPAIQYNIIGQPLRDGALNLTSQTQFAYFDRVLESRQEGFNSVSTFRFDTEGKLSMPLHPLFFNVNPFIGSRITAYNNGVDSSTQTDDGPNRYRFIGSFGFDISTNISKVYGIKNKFLQIDHLRHIITPELRVVSNPIVTENSDRLVQIDEVDALDDSHVIMMGLRNRFQTKRGEPGNMKTVDFVNFDVEMYLFPGKKAVGTRGISGMQISSDDFIQWDLTVHLSDRLIFESDRNEFNLAEFGLDVFNSGVRFQHTQGWGYFLGYRFIKDISSSIIVSMDYRLTEKWSVAFYEHFDFKPEEDLISRDFSRDSRDPSRDSRNLKTQLVFSRFFHEFRGDFTIELDEVRDDQIVRFDVVPLIFTKQTRRQRRLWF